MKNCILVSTLALLSLLGAACGGGAGAASASASKGAVALGPCSGRTVIAVRDWTKSFRRYISDANIVLRRAVEAMGPCDRLILVEVGGGRFDAQTQVREHQIDGLQAVSEPKTYPEYLVAQKSYRAVWEEAERRKSLMLADIDRAPKLDSSSTNLYGPLEYVAHRIGSLPAPGGPSSGGPSSGAVRCVLAGDLLHDLDGVVSDFPPKKVESFAAAEIMLLFVPWQGAAQAKRKSDAWRAYFTGGGAIKFRMLDEAQSRHVNILEPSPVPRRPRNPFVSAGA